ncbi:hypothetical protein ACLB2K_067989 [Fragaria x ananassa]
MKSLESKGMTIKPRLFFQEGETRPGEFQMIPGVENFAEIAPSFPGLPQMVIDSISKCDVDYRRELFSSILLSGGTLSMQQLKERLEKDLKESPRAARVKVLASGNATERRFSVWIGGSILVSLGQFRYMWFTKAEYEEHGASYVQRKFDLLSWEQLQIEKKTGKERTCQGGKVVGDAVGVLWGGDAPSLSPDGGERRDVRTLRTYTYTHTHTHTLKLIQVSVRRLCHHRGDSTILVMTS